MEQMLLVFLCPYICVWIHHLLSGSSLNTYKHFLQLLDGDFQKFDYDDETNMKIYGSVEPPHYDLKKVTAPTKVFVGDGDFLSTVMNAQKLSNALPNSMGCHVVERSDFNHIDFTFANDAREMVYDYMISDINRIRDEASCDRFWRIKMPNSFIIPFNYIHLITYKFQNKSAGCMNIFLLAYCITDFDWFS